MNAYSLVFKQTIRLAFRKGGGALGTLAFYIIIITLFTFALGPQSMHEHAGAVMCAGLLLATVTALPLFYERDFEDGTLEQFLLQPVLLEMLTLAKICGQWFACAAPILVATPLLAVMSGIDREETVHILVLLMLASPTIVALGSIAAALTLGSRQGGLLQALIVIPLYIPVLIFAAGGGNGAVWFLSGLLFGSLPLSCFVSAALIRLSQD